MKNEDLPAEISHNAHPAHRLKLLATGGSQFRCSGCKERGDGPRYVCKCRTPGFRLHTCCALADNKGATSVHRLFGGSAFVFRHKPTPPVDDTVCDACGEPARGFVYHCIDKNLDVHPCCWTLQPTITVHGAAFELCNDKASSHHYCALCSEKGRRSRFWAYRWYNANDGRHVYLHVACVKKAARRTWNEAYHKRVGSGGGIVQASMPAMEAAVQQSLARNVRRSSRSGGFHHIKKIVSTVARIIIAVIFGNPLAMIGAVVGPGGYFS